MRIVFGCRGANRLASAYSAALLAIPEISRIREVKASGGSADWRSSMGAIFSRGFAQGRVYLRTSSVRGRSLNVDPLLHVFLPAISTFRSHAANVDCNDRMQVLAEIRKQVS
ncbi:MULTISPECIES: hypothetical protein [Paraburkholderia]|jgi:hypothetical protein|uniref:hypothetical protein n=1 Tax=Paraburkholderia TaxID=1822464 RepID=UPI0038BD3A91